MSVPLSPVQNACLSCRSRWVSTLNGFDGQRSLPPESPAGLGNENQVAVTDSNGTVTVLFVEARPAAPQPREVMQNTPDRRGLGSGSGRECPPPTCLLASLGLLWPRPLTPEPGGSERANAYLLNRSPRWGGE